MRILFLSQRVPYPPNRGDKITTWRLIERMKRTHEVTCVAFAHDEKDMQAAQDLNAMGIPTHAFPYRRSLAIDRPCAVETGQTDVEPCLPSSRTSTPGIGPRKVGG